MAKDLNKIAAIKRPLFMFLIFVIALSQYGGCTSSKGNNDPVTATPIKHLVIIFMENASFDQIFGTYPIALNPPGEPKFITRPDTPSVNNLNGVLLTNNPNETNPLTSADYSPTHVTKTTTIPPSRKHETGG